MEKSSIQIFCKQEKNTFQNSEGYSKVHFSVEKANFEPFPTDFRSKLGTKLSLFFFLRNLHFTYFQIVRGQQ